MLSNEKKGGEKMKKLDNNKKNALDNALDNDKNLIVEKFHLAGVSYYYKYVKNKNRKKLSGPYWYAYFWHSGKVKCKYVGKTITEISKYE
jgi:predicted nicotinamide N-methyase